MNSQLTFAHIVLRITINVFSLIAFASAAQADIYQWEYIDPDDPSQGNQQSTMLAPDGAGVDAVPGANLDYRNLTRAYLIGADVRNASFYGGMLSAADFTGAEVRHANFAIHKNCSIHWGCDVHGTGLTLEQLYSTASYKSHELSGVGLQDNVLVGGNFAGQNLTNANFYAASLTDADFTDSDVRGATLGRAITSTGPRGGIQIAQLYSTASYRTHDLSGINLRGNNLAGGDFVGQNLTNANFDTAWLVDADFSGAEVRGANFGMRTHGLGGLWLGSGITLAQLYSTASYQAKDLSGIGLQSNTLTGGNFAGQNLTNACFDEAFIYDADLTSADIRGAGFNVTFGPNLAAVTNLILTNGHMRGLRLAAGNSLVVRDYDGPQYDPSRTIPISVYEHMAIGPGGTLRIVFEADDWDSTISFAPGIPVTLGGTLELTFAAEVNLASQLGRTFNIFDWTGVNPAGTFSVTSPYRWDLSNLYTTGEVALTAVPEPANFALAAAVAGMILLRRRPST